ncbi:nuclear factor interleukin-3-regulated protein-like [Biomphalaria glabrata]|uniref:Nuclear factor interleukin-3-regulated protein-like n=1 Tax=Biomphalaria glabrata TaxID=6526 RepID=A0A9W3A296_BIOGL|nr:nuclear factor interleukin-3-regulated protein-like [Biomphalaria glabrata]XP_055881435.1 nuclear factor interleukin-3-regulated protein-like [Biomphalaria glabrata]XP_055881436.1 nuclear factor interleukin-3-regulated protein-like [Biomphalaria glabrata]
MNQDRPTCQHQQQQQNATPQLPPPAFMSDSDPWKSCDEDQEESSSKNAHRRAKRNIPETEKDDKYWEKRKRNNLAAKRSRENKRLLESDIRQKVALLEEQNALLRKEIVIIKARYGIPTEQSLLTPGEQAQCILEVKAAREANELRKKRESAGNIDDVSSTSPSVFSVGLHSSLDDSDAEKVCSESSDNSPKVSETTYNLQTSYGPAAYGPFNPSPSWAPAASSSQQGLASNSSGHPFSPSPGHQPKQSSTPSSYQAKHSSPYTRYGPGSMSGYPRPYDFYSMQYGNQSTPRIYEEGYPGAPADLRMNIKRQEEQRACRGQTSLKSPIPQSDFLDDIAAMGYAHGGRPHIGQEQLRRQSADHTSVMSSGFSRLSCDLKNVNADGVKPIMQQDTKLELDLN